MEDMEIAELSIDEQKSKDSLAEFAREYKEKHKVYTSLNIYRWETFGIEWALEAVRLPKPQISNRYITKDENIELLSKLVKAGDDHAKAVRGIVVYLQMKCQIGWLIEYLTYRIGVECLSSSSSMHDELKQLIGEELAEQKQQDLPKKQYTRIEMISYQALRHMYKARKNHRHPDWAILCSWIKTLPYAKELITI